MHCYKVQIVLQEVPGEISIAFFMSGCPIRCNGCHSSFLWKEALGERLTNNRFKAYLSQYKDLATCVLFMGGEWHEEALRKKLQLAKAYQYKTCLYSGNNDVSETLLNELDWVKTGPWVPALGGLDKENTNQIFMEVSSKEILNHLFIKKESI